jgi:hypothetical protein
LAPEKPKANGQLNGSHHYPPRRGSTHRDRNARSYPMAPVLGAEASAELRDRLLTELNGLDSGDDAALWAKRSFPEKNTLTAGDAQRVEEGFGVKLASLAPSSADMSLAPATVESPIAVPASKALKGGRRSKPVDKSIDKSVLWLAEPRRVRDRDHVRYVATQPCLVCGRQPSDAHHLRFAQSRALGRKVSDELTVPLCRGHHREVHRYGDEAAWWKKVGIDPTVTSRALWMETHPLTSPGQMRRNGANSDLASRPQHGAPKHERSISSGGHNYETKPITTSPKV